MKKTWRQVNKILHRNKVNTQPSQLLIDGSLTSDKKKIANAFNLYFTNVASNLNKKIPKTTTLYQDYLKNPNMHSLFLSKTSPYEVYLTICS